MEELRQMLKTKFRQTFLSELNLYEKMLSTRYLSW